MGSTDGISIKYNGQMFTPDTDLKQFGSAGEKAMLIFDFNKDGTINADNGEWEYFAKQAEIEAQQAQVRANINECDPYVVKYYQKEINKLSNKIDKIEKEFDSIGLPTWRDLCDFEGTFDGSIQFIGLEPGKKSPKGVKLYNIEAIQMGVLDEESGYFTGECCKKGYVVFADNVSEEDKQKYLEMLNKALKNSNKAYKLEQKYRSLYEEYDKLHKLIKCAEAGYFDHVLGTEDENQFVEIYNQNNPYLKQIKDITAKRDKLWLKAGRTQQDEVQLQIYNTQINQLEEASRQWSMAKKGASSIPKKTGNKVSADKIVNSENQNTTLGGEISIQTNNGDLTTLTNVQNTSTISPDNNSLSNTTSVGNEIGFRNGRLSAKAKTISSATVNISTANNNSNSDESNSGVSANYSGLAELNAEYTDRNVSASASLSTQTNINKNSVDNSGTVDISANANYKDLNVVVKGTMSATHHIALKEGDENRFLISNASTSANLNYKGLSAELDYTHNKTYNHNDNDSDSITINNQLRWNGGYVYRGWGAQVSGLVSATDVIQANDSNNNQLPENAVPLEGDNSESKAPYTEYRADLYKNFNQGNAKVYYIRQGDANVYGSALNLNFAGGSDGFTYNFAPAVSAQYNDKARSWNLGQGMVAGLGQEFQTNFKGRDINAGWNLSVSDNNDMVIHPETTTEFVEGQMVERQITKTDIVNSFSVNQNWHYGRIHGALGYSLMYATNQPVNHIATANIGWQINDQWDINLDGNYNQGATQDYSANIKVIHKF